jgi:stage II sporulation protein D
MLRRDVLALLLGTSPLRADDPAPSALLIEISTGRRLAAQNPTASIAPPGSTLKPFVIAGLMKRGRLRAEESWPCPGRLTIAGRSFNCSHPPLPSPVDARTAIAYSCNCFVAHMAERYRPGELAEELASAGFSRVKPARDLDATRLQALGEEGIEVTLEELAQAYRRLASNAPAPIRDGLEDAVQYGTAQLAAVSGVKVAGKTGSAVAASGARIAWFAGFIPSRAPEVVVVAMVAGRSGGSDAAPVAARMLASYRAARPAAGPTVRLPRQEVPLERYVAGVLAGEASVMQSGEALKAMAIAARTYAVRLRGRHEAEGYDFCTTTHCQRVELDGVTPRLEAAAAATAGELLWFEGKPAFTPYSRDCGGRTEDAAAVWPDLAAPYLRSHDDPHCPRTPWQWSADPRQAAEALRRAGLRAPRTLDAIAIAQRTASDRAAVLLLSGAGESARMSAGSFRFAIGRELGWNLVPSDRYEILPGLVFQGFGSGHGVGLCQHGAERMGGNGRSYREILAFYYPGTAPGRTAQGIPWQMLSGERVTLRTTDPQRDRDVLAVAERELRVLAGRTGWRAPAGIEIRVYPDLDTFRNASGAPGWVAAYTVGHRIHLQPTAVLRARNALETTVRHEVLHVLVESHASARLPLWFREGLVSWLDKPSTPGGTPRMPSDEEFADQARARQAYADSARTVAGLVNRYGEGVVSSWLERGIPEDVTKASNSHAATERK